jgi:CubicO group peptidase (beta-lactamase class C family)
MHVTCLDGTDKGMLQEVDAVITRFMEERKIPGGAVAAAYQGRTVLARGYTLQEDPPGLIQPTSLFRIASVSKPLCAVAVLRLVDDRRLSLEDRAYEVLGLDGRRQRELGPDPAEVSVLHLLQHQAGFDRSISLDPHSVDRAIAGELGKPLPISREDIVEYVTRRPLDFAPGTRYAYSNYGYQLLGHIVEKITGEEFTAFVKRAILEPLGIVGPRMGRTLAHLRAEGEVVYHSSNPNVFGNVMEENGSNAVPVQYGGYNLENMVSSGAWIASPVDLVRFACAFDDPAACPILSEDKVRAMFAPPIACRTSDTSYYACGWAVQEKEQGLETSHGGCLQGVASTLRRRPDGVTFCALFNRREETSPSSWDVDGALNAVFDAMAPEDWPAV